ncbi:MAG TPA: PAS domain S-box protein [Candidatus Acidoferrum sp.]|nr:PAS domain S-box protein [Candidatus Acidoferrum sp.]
MDKTGQDVQDSTPQDIGELNRLKSISGRAHLNPRDQDRAEGGMTERLPASSGLLDLGGQTHLIELFPMAAYAVRAPDGVIAWFNSRAAELWGRVPVVGDTDERFCGAYKLYHADGTRMAHCDTPMALALETGASVHEQEVVIERPDGSRVTVSMHIDPIRDEGGAIVGVVNFFHDINERKQAQRATALLAAIVDSSDDAIVSKNLDGVITSWNKGAERLFGYSAEEAIGQHITLIVPADRQDEEPRIIGHLRRGERVDHFETVRVRKDGTLLDISLTISPVKDATGRVVGASKVARDITEWKRAERIQAEQARLLEMSNDAIFVRDATDRVKYWNKAASDLYGYTREEALGRVIHELLHTEFPEPLESINEQLRRDDRWTGELVHRKKDGTQIVVVSRWALDRDIHGNPRSILETNNDITQQKRTENALRSAHAELEERVKERTAQLLKKNQELSKQAQIVQELSARLLQLQDEERRRIARELHDSAGQLIAAIGMNTSAIAREKGKLSPSAEKCAEENVQLVDQAVTEIRTISHLLHPPMLDEIGLESALRWFIEGFAKRSKIEVNLVMTLGSERLPGDLEIAIFRMIQECLTNIHRHSGSKTAEVRLAKKHGCIHVEVSDQGKGIPLDKQLELNSAGTLGVGFRGMRERVRQLGGALHLNSDGNGTSVTVTLPIERATASKVATGTA